jgi:hypothetical protein
MRIQSLHIENFKRFSSLSIQNLPSSAKLVLLIGSNGSGKSSLFDAFDWLGRGNFRGISGSFEQLNEYYRKNQERETRITILLADGKRIYHEDRLLKENADLAKKFFGRSSIRIVPHITNSANISAIVNDADGPRSYIENDTRFINDVFSFIQSINTALREPVFRGEQADTLTIFRQFIQPLNESLLNVFGGNSTTTIQIAEFEDATPNAPAKLLFRKGTSKINYDLLSHGEKQVVILLLNFIVRKKYYEDAVIFIDEMDCHLNTALQFNLLQEIVTTWIPDSAQLWTASHALGFIDYARSSDEAATIDFDLLDFDVPQTLVPVPKENVEVYDIAIPKQMLSVVLGDRKLVFCENKNDALLNLVGLERTIFVGVSGAADVFLNVKRDANYHSLRDRDFLTDTEIERLEEVYPNHHILRYYCFENYLYHPDNIAELGLENFDKQAYTAELIRQKNLRKDFILVKVVDARKTYQEFKTDEKLRDSDVESIIQDLASDDIECFYKFFSMKSEIDKSYLASLQLSPERLVQTEWFKKQLANILENKQ